MNEKILYPSRNPAHDLSRKTLVISLFIWINVTFLHTAYAQEGEALHKENCITCHAAMTGGEGLVLYTRPDRGVKSLNALNKQVDRCQSSLSLNWSNDQIDSVQQYLNELFYQF